MRLVVVSSMGGKLGNFENTRSATLVISSSIPSPIQPSRGKYNENCPSSALAAKQH